MTTMDISAAMSQIYAIQEAMQIDHPHSSRKVKVIKSFHYWPDRDEVITETPVWVNNWTAPTLEFQSALLTADFTVHMQLLASSDVSVNEAADIASAFYPLIVDAFSANVKLGLSEWTVRRLRGGDPTLAVIQPATETTGKEIIGLDLYLDLFCMAAVNNLPGDPPS